MNLQIEYVRPDELKAAEYNPRTISDSALSALSKLIEEHGFIDPVIARRDDGLILGGHQRIRANALRRQPDELIPCVFVSGLDDTRAKALNVALNNPEAQGDFDDEMLAELLRDIDACELDAAALTGFSPEHVDQLTALLDDFSPVGDLDQLIETDEAAMETDADAVVLVFEMPAELYRRVKDDFDELISKHDLSCHFRPSGL